MGEYTLALQGVILADPDGNKIPNASGVGGRVIVQLKTPTPTWTPTGPTPTHTSTPTPTVTPRIVRVDLGMAIGAPGRIVRVPVMLQSAGLATVATANDITYRSDLFAVETTACAINPAFGKTLVVSRMTDGAALETLRVFVQSLGNSSPIPDGLLYECLHQVEHAP